MLRRVLFLVGLGVSAAGVKISPSAADAHYRADQVMLPRFVAAFNDWRQNHPSWSPNDPASVRDHLAKIDAKDQKRWKAAKDAWHEVEKGMNEAGY